MNTTLSRTLAVLLTAATAWLAYDLPFARPYVAVVLALCFVCQFCVADAWLLFIPALLPVIDLTLWSGRLYLNEFDLLILTVAAAHFWRAPPGHWFPHLATPGGIIIVLLVLSYIASGWIGASPLPPPDANELGAYFSHYNALRVAKGFAWALLLLAPLQWRLSVDAAKTASLFVIGTSIGLGLVGLVVLWERGVFLAIAQSPGLYAGRYAIAGAMLDFADGYRATALFSELHTGGEAIDTYLALAVPIAAAGIVMFRNALCRLLCLGGFGLGTYAVVATFSRGLYAGCGIAIATVLLLAFVSGGRSRLQGRYAMTRAALAVILGIAALITAYFRGGFSALAFGLVLGFASLTILHLVGVRSRGLAALAVGVLTCAVTYALWNDFAHSRYHPLDPTSALVRAVGCAIAIAAAAALLGGKTIPRESLIPAAATFALFAVVSTVAIPAIVGYRMVERFSTVGDDFQERRGHWEQALALIGPNWTDYALGMGLGSFPRLYFLHGHGAESKASYRYERDGTQSWLALGAGDFNLTQKLSMEPQKEYNLSLLMRRSGAGLGLKLCPKLILFNDRYTPDCLEFNFKPAESGKWVSQSVSFYNSTLGQHPFFAWPTTLMLHLDSGAPLDITDIRLTASNGNVVANGNFAAGGDRWILISDFEHLAWHVKNLYIAVFFDSGAAGLAVFVIAVLVALFNAFRTALQRLPIGVGLAGALAGFLVVGFVGSLLDNPRPACLFFFLLFWALQQSSAQGSPAKNK